MQNHFEVYSLSNVVNPSRMCLAPFSSVTTFKTTRFEESTGHPIFNGHQTRPPRKRRYAARPVKLHTHPEAKVSQKNMVYDGPQMLFDNAMQLMLRNANAKKTIEWTGTLQFIIEWAKAPCSRRYWETNVC